MCPLYRIAGCPLLRGFKCTEVYGDTIWTLLNFGKGRGGHKLQGPQPTFSYLVIVPRCTAALWCIARPWQSCL